MRTALLLCTALVLGWTLPAFSGPVELFTVDERDKLIKQMKTEVSELLEKKQIPTSDGRYAASIVLQSLAIDPPLKTKEEVDEVGQGCLGFNDLPPRKLMESVADGLNASDGNRLSPPGITFELACDLRRLSRLGAILLEAKVESKALDTLTRKVIDMIRSIKEL